MINLIKFAILKASIGIKSIAWTTLLIIQKKQPKTVQKQLEAWSTDIQNVLNVVTGLFAVIGGFLIFLQYMQGNDQAQKNFIKFVIGLAIFGLINLISSFFI